LLGDVARVAVPRRARCPLPAKKIRTAGPSHSNHARYGVDVFPMTRRSHPAPSREAQNRTPDPTWGGRHAAQVGSGRPSRTTEPALAERSEAQGAGDGQLVDRAGVVTGDRAESTEGTNRRMRAPDRAARSLDAKEIRQYEQERLQRRWTARRRAPCSPLGKTVRFSGRVGVSTGIDRWQSSQLSDHISRGCLPPMVGSSGWLSARS